MHQETKNIIWNVFEWKRMHKNRRITWVYIANSCLEMCWAKSVYINKNFDLRTPTSGACTFAETNVYRNGDT